MVSQLRAKTDSPMMECKKALIEAKGDFDRAEEILRVKLGNKATKVGSRIAAEGTTAFFTSTSNSECRISKLIFLRYYRITKAKFAEISRGFEPSVFDALFDVLTRYVNDIRAPGVDLGSLGLIDLKADSVKTFE